MKVFPGTVKPKSDISPELQAHLRYPEDLFKVQRSLLAKYHVNDPVTFFSTSDFWDVPLDPNPTASSYQPPYYIVAKDLASNDHSSSFQLTSAMNRFRRDFLAAYVAGFETETRIARAVNFHHYDKGWHPTATMGVFGAAAAVSIVTVSPLDSALVLPATSVSVTFKV